MSKRERRGYYVKGVFVTSGSEADQMLRDELHDANAPSRSAQKKASKSLRDLGEQLIAAPKARLVGLPLPEPLEDAIAEARRIKSLGAKRRQTQLVGKLMRQLDDETLDAIRAALARPGSSEHRSA
jgi:ribosome-associated protein